MTVMRKKTDSLIVVATVLMAFVTGCSGQYKGMPREEVLAYQTHATYGELHATTG